MLKIAADFRVLLNSFDSLSLPETKGSYAIFGSGPMAIRGLKETHDLDIVVSPSVWDILIKAGHKEDRAPSGTQRILIKDNFNNEIELMKEWFKGVSAEEILESSERISGHWYGSLELLLKWKINMGRPKDAADISIIKEYLIKENKATPSSVLSFDQSKTSLTSYLDRISNRLEILGCVKEAYTLDIIANTLDRWLSNESNLFFDEVSNQGIEPDIAVKVLDIASEHGLES